LDVYLHLSNCVVLTQELGIKERKKYMEVESWEYEAASSMVNRFPR
jgi:hypothetical protein